MAGNSQLFPPQQHIEVNGSHSQRVANVSADAVAGRTWHPFSTFARKERTGIRHAVSVPFSVPSVSAGRGLIKTRLRPGPRLGRSRGPFARPPSRPRRARRRYAARRNLYQTCSCEPLAVQRSPGTLANEGGTTENSARSNLLAFDRTAATQKASGTRASRRSSRSRLQNSAVVARAGTSSARNGSERWNVRRCGR
jgi:hypothetical protein